jgi:hypothetical protein
MDNSDDMDPHKSRKRQNSFLTLKSTKWVIATSRRLPDSQLIEDFTLSFCNFEHDSAS